MFQASSQIHDPNLVSIPFAKFSHNTSPYGTRNFIWNHVGQRDDLDLIIRNNRVVDEHGNITTQVTMKITAGADTLESHDLGELVTFIHEFDPTSGAEHPVQVVIKSPFMAMRYPKTINSVRRIQLKFRNDDDFRRAMNILKDLGFPITESGPTAASASRPNISPVPSSFSSASIPRPALKGSTLPLPSTRPTLLPTADLSPKSSFKVPMPQDTRSLEAHRPNTAHSFVSNSFNRPTSASTTVSAPTPPSSVSTVSPFYDTIRQLPSLYPNQFEYESDGQRLSHPTLQGSNITDATRRSTLYLPQHQTQIASDRTSDYPLIASPFFLPRPSTVPLGPSPTELGRRSDYTAQTASPLSHEITLDSLEFSGANDDWIPPRRELPFPKARDSGRGRASSTSDLPSLPKPTPMQTADSPVEVTPSAGKTAKEISTLAPKPAKKRAAPRKPHVKKKLEETVPPKKGPEMNTVAEFDTDKVASVQEDEVSPLAAKSNAARPSTAAGLQSKAATTKKRSAPARPSSSAKKSKMVDQGTQTQMQSGRDHITALEPGSNNVPQAPPAPPPQNYLDMLDTFITTHKSRPPPQELWERPGYTEADDEQRQAMLTDFICENLENADFLKLCEDTEKSWRRIGLGM